MGSTFGVAQLSENKAELWNCGTRTQATSLRGPGTGLSYRPSQDGVNRPWQSNMWASEIRKLKFLKT